MSNSRISRRAFRPQSGFTLVEMIIAIALSAIVATMAYQAFEGATRNAQSTREVLRDINKLDKAWQLIGQDIRNVLPPMPPQVLFRGESLKSKGKDSFQVIMIFARRGWANPLGRLRSDLQQVSYRIDEGKLWRDYLPERNVPLESIDFERESLHQLLLENVTDIQLRFLSDSNIKSNGKSVLEGTDYINGWEADWPPVNPTGASALPIAVEITIEVEGVGRSVRLFEIPQK